MDSIAARRRASGPKSDSAPQGDEEAPDGTNAGAIPGIALSIETRDPFTAAHQRRVSRLAAAMAVQMGLSESEIRGISLASAIHDIGKSCVPSRILCKSGPLNAFELSLFRGHPQVGHDMLKGFEVPWPVASIVLQHHERMDGSGYPFALRGDDILPQARIVAVADVFEAMTSDRPYRPALRLEAVLAHLSEHRGRLYDERAVDACILLTGIKGFQID